MAAISLEEEEEEEEGKAVELRSCGGSESADEPGGEALWRGRSCGWVRWCSEEAKAGGWLVLVPGVFGCLLITAGLK